MSPWLVGLLGLVAFAATVHSLWDHRRGERVPIDEKSYGRRCPVCGARGTQLCTLEGGAPMLWQVHRARLNGPKDTG